MALGALVGAYSEDDSGQLRALLPLAGQTLIEYQLRSLHRIGAAPLLVLVERVPSALDDAFERLRGEGIQVTPVGDGSEAASRLEAGDELLLLADGILPDIADLDGLMDHEGRAVVTVPDDEDHQDYERLDSERRWAGLARMDAGMLGSTAAIVGDWDLVSTLLRRTVQAGVDFRASQGGEGRGPFFPRSEEDMPAFERRLLLASRGQRDDWVARYLLPFIDEMATEWLMESRIRPRWLVQLAILLILSAAFLVMRDHDRIAAVLILLALPLDIIAARLAILRLRPMVPSLLSLRLLWPATILLIGVIGWAAWRQDGDPAAGLAAITAIAFAEARRMERGHGLPKRAEWLFARRPALFLAVPFLFLAMPQPYLLGLLAYATLSFFIVQQAVHRGTVD